MIRPEASAPASAAAPRPPVTRRRLSRRAFAGGAVAFALSTTACAATGAEAPRTSSAPVTLDYWDAQAGGPTITPIIQRFQERQPRFTVNVTSMSQDESLDKFRAAFAAGTAPDLWKSTLVYNADFASRKASAKLEPFVAGIKSDLLPLALEEGRRYKNTLYNLPSEMDVYLQYYHAGLYARAGLQPPETFEQLVQVGQQFVRLSTPERPVWAITITGARGGHFQNLMACATWNGPGAGNGIFDDKGACLLTTPASIAGYQAWGDLLRRHQIAPTPGTPGVSIAAGTLAAQWGFLGSIAGLDRNPGPDSYGSTKPPAGPKGRFAPWGANGWMMSSATKHPGDVWLLLSFLFSPEVNGEWGQARGVMPSNARAYTQSWLQRPVYKPAVDLLHAPKEMLLIPTWLPEWSTFVTEIAVKANTRFLAGEITAQQAAQEMATFLTDAQKRYLAG
jgi:ABC-type glycerol-3-phosphate transport system substrate-binding protein